MGRLSLLGSILLLLVAPLAVHAGTAAAAESSVVAEAVSVPRRESWTFFSPTLDRDMPLIALLPPGYDSESKVYPVLYMLHGYAATNEEWEWWGLFAQAEAMMASGEVPPFIIALPQGDQDYWVDHANGGPQWGKYLAQDVTAEVDARYRTLPDAAHRAVGGLSMGADGAMQVALNYPRTFGVVGMHSPVLRPHDTAPDFFGNKAYFEAHYPVTMVQKKTSQARELKIEVDAGNADVWFPNTRKFHETLQSLKIPHQWHVRSGVHDGEYWTAHAGDYLRFYGASLGAALHFMAMAFGGGFVEPSFLAPPPLQSLHAQER